MQRALVDVPVHVTAVRFNETGMAIPTRVECFGKTVSVEAAATTGLLLICINKAYYRLTRQRRHWLVTSLA